MFFLFFQSFCPAVSVWFSAWLDAQKSISFAPHNFTWNLHRCQKNPCIRWPLHISNGTAPGTQYKTISDCPMSESNKMGTTEDWNGVTFLQKVRRCMQRSFLSAVVLKSLQNQSDTTTDRKCPKFGEWNAYHIRNELRTVDFDVFGALEDIHFLFQLQSLHQVTDRAEQPALTRSVSKTQVLFAQVTERWHETMFTWQWRRAILYCRLTSVPLEIGQR